MLKNMELIAGDSIRGIHVEWIASALCIHRNASLVSYALNGECKSGRSVIPFMTVVDHVCDITWYP